MATRAHERPSRARALLGVDVGGTFTDAALVVGEELVTAKVPTTPDEQSEGVLAAVERALAAAGLDPAAVERFAHGMTVATNALLEERGARTALLTTEGFTDVIEIARQNRPELYRLCKARPAPLVPTSLRLGVRERIGPQGVVSPLDGSSLDEAITRLRDEDVEAVAISFLHSYLDPSHERRAAEAVAERLPNVHVSASHDVLSVFREYERTSTTVIDAYLSPLLSRYLGRLTTSARRLGIPAPEVMQSSGGLMSAADAARHAAWTVLSGPAGGAVGAARLGALAGDRNVISFDMGGTSCDVAVVDGGRVRQTSERSIGGRALQLPMVDVHTVGAGGGSIGWADAGGALRVGPRSAGARPGPACYGLGGREATVTDANLLLGYLDPDTKLAGDVTLDIDAAGRAVDDLGRRLGLDVLSTAAGIVRVADQEMLRALRVVTVARGVDPRSYALVAFGGAGPMHALRLAEDLGVRRVLCPRAAGVLSALGLVLSERRHDHARSVLLSGGDLTSDRIASSVAELANDARRQLPDAEIEVTFDVRYRGQAFELPVSGDERSTPEQVRAAYEQAHVERYGYADQDAALEIVNVRVAAIGAGARPRLRGDTSSRVRRRRREAVFGGERVATEVVTGEMGAGEDIEGPAVCELPEATVVVPPRWRGSVGEDGTLVLEWRA
jgi:N-methylhydantoinase A